MLAATHTLVEALHTARISANSESFLYGVSMRIWVCFNCPDTFSSVRSLLRRSSVFAGIYPQNAKDCPFRPEAISASISDDGPTAGTTSMPCLCARATSCAPGSATAGNPASEISATSPASNSFRYPSMVAWSVCSLSSKNWSSPILPFRPARER